MTKTSNLLGELPKNTFEENLASTIDWYIQNYDWWDE
jgi:dTDP-D-glucose 4,6-dehydratase